MLAHAHGILIVHGAAGGGSPPIVSIATKCAAAGRNGQRAHGRIATLVRGDSSSAAAGRVVADAKIRIGNRRMATCRLCPWLDLVSGARTWVMCARSSPSFALHTHLRNQRHGQHVDEAIILKQSSCQVASHTMIFKGHKLDRERDLKRI